MNENTTAQSGAVPMPRRTAETMAAEYCAGASNSGSCAAMVTAAPESAILRLPKRLRNGGMMKITATCTRFSAVLRPLLSTLLPRMYSQ